MSNDAFNPFLDDEDEEAPTASPPQAPQDSTALPPPPEQYGRSSVADGLTDVDLTLDGFDELELGLPEPDEVEQALPEAIPAQSVASEDEFDFATAEVDPVGVDIEPLILDDFDFTDSAAPSPVVEPQEEFDFTLPPVEPQTTGEIDLEDWGFNEESDETEALPTPAVSEEPVYIVEDDDEAEWEDEEDTVPPSTQDEFDFTSLLDEYEDPADEKQDEFDFTSLATEPNPAVASPADGALEEDWGFLEEDEAPEQAYPSAEEEAENWALWGMEEVEESDEAEEVTEVEDSAPETIPSFGAFPTEEELALMDLEESEEKPEDLNAYLNELSAGIDEEEAEESEVPAWKKKIQDTVAQIKSELRGGDEPEANAREERAPGGPGLLTKLLSPYAWLASKVLGLLLLVLSPLKRIPGLGRFIGDNKVFRVISYILPLLILALILQWQGSKPLPPAKAITFPDGGAAAIGKFGYDSKTNEAYGTVVNKGEVIANVTPTFKVYSIQPSLNPLSFFFVKPGAVCKGEPVEVPIDGQVKVKAKCEVKGSPKKITGAIKW